jgi:hypothetical protein
MAGGIIPPAIVRFATFDFEDHKWNRATFDLLGLVGLGYRRRSWWPVDVRVA